MSPVAQILGDGTTIGSSSAGNSAVYRPNQGASNGRLVGDSNRRSPGRMSSYSGSQPSATITSIEYSLGRSSPIRWTNSVAHSTRPPPAGVSQSGSDPVAGSPHVGTDPPQGPLLNRDRDERFVRGDLHRGQVGHAGFVRQRTDVLEGWFESEQLVPVRSLPRVDERGRVSSPGRNRQEGPAVSLTGIGKLHRRADLRTRPLDMVEHEAGWVGGHPESKACRTVVHQLVGGRYGWCGYFQFGLSSGLKLLKSDSHRDPSSPTSVQSVACTEA